MIFVFVILTDSSFVLYSCLIVANMLNDCYYLFLMLVLILMDCSHFFFMLTDLSFVSLTLIDFSYGFIILFLFMFLFKTLTVYLLRFRGAFQVGPSLSPSKQRYLTGGPRVGGDRPDNDDDENGVLLEIVCA